MRSPDLGASAHAEGTASCSRQRSGSAGKRISTVPRQPEASHPRWSQATERTLSGPRVPTQLYNGYTEFVADIYKNLSNEKLFM